MGASVVAKRPEAPLSSEERRRRWFEVGLMYLGMTTLTFAVGWLGLLWAPLGALSALIVAIGFMFLPVELLHRRGENIQHSGIGGRDDLVDESTVHRAVRSTRQALKISLLILPVYVLGAHVWHSAQGREATLDARAFARWSEDVRGLRTTQLAPGLMAIEARADLVKLSWRLSSHERGAHFKLKLDGPHRVISRSRTSKLKVHASAHTQLNSPQVIELWGSKQGWVNIKTQAQNLRLTALIDGVPVAVDRLVGGEFNSTLSMTSDGVVEIRRDMTWLWSIFLIQLFLVGLPEEIFYRGYLQSRLDGLVGQDRVIFGVPFNLTSALLCSALFALAHIVTVPNLGRLAVFFPSVLFGWMRRAYHDTLPPAIFHAICNVIAQLIWGIYVFG